MSRCRGRYDRPSIDGRDDPLEGKWRYNAEGRCNLWTDAEEGTTLVARELRSSRKGKCCEPESWRGRLDQDVGKVSLSSNGGSEWPGRKARSPWTVEAIE